MHSTPPAPPVPTGARVLVSGASGYLASRLLPQLAAAGAKVLAQTRHPESMAAAAIDAAGGAHPVLLAGTPGHAGTDAAIRDFAPEYVFALAGRTDATAGDANRHAMQIEHVDYARHLADAVAGPALRRLVYTGSCAEYGNGPAPFQEDQELLPDDPYACAKADAVRLLQARGDLPQCVVRPFVVYGPAQRRGLVHFVLQRALADEGFDTSEGSQTRDLIWVDDVVDGLLAAATAPAAEGAVINLGTGVETPVRTVVEAVCAAAGGGQPRFGTVPLRPGEVLRSVAAVDRARRLLGWKAAVDLQDGLRRTVHAAREAAAR